MSKFFAVNELVRVKMTIRSSRVIHPGEIATVTRLSVMRNVALYDLQFSDGTVAKLISQFVLESR